jgi:hypothetical protein
MSRIGKTKRARISKVAGRKKGAAHRAGHAPLKLTRRAPMPQHDEHGPLEWLTPMLESSYTQLVPRGVAPQAAAILLPVSTFRPRTATTLAPARAGVWRDTILEYKQRKSAAVTRHAALPAARPGAQPVPETRSWVPLGPSVVINGQTVGNQPVGGRVGRLAVAPGGSVVYAATANGGVFRSADGATSWRSMMDRFDLDPTSFASASLVCGAIAIDPADPNRVYVGTGEGDTLQFFRSNARVVRALPAYRGVGVIRSDDGGASWIPEPSTPDLAGEAFFAIAVDPRDRENAIAATTCGLYRRTLKAGSGYEWTQLQPGVHSSVVAASAGGMTRFLCARWGDDAVASGIFYSDDGGGTWQPAGTGFPAADAGRIALGVQGNKPDLVYAFVAKQSDDTAHGLYRLDAIGGNWKPVSGLPTVLAVNGGRSQGGYDLAIAVDPVDPNLVYLGGSYVEPDPYPASIWRCAIGAASAAYKVLKAASIGTHAHADVHSLVHTPGDPDELWCTCDGGVFLNRAPRASGEFASQNNGLACLCSNFIAQHPTDPNILFTGLQDNGTARTAAGPIWSHVLGGDGGYCLINWANPNLVLIYANGVVYRSTSGGTSANGWAPVWQFGWATMTQPIVGAPYNPGTPADASLVAVAAGQEVYLSQDFASSWPITFAIAGDGAGDAIFAAAFASPARLFLGTSLGHVFRADRAGDSWTVTRLDNAAAGPLGLGGLIADIAVDWDDTTLNSVYVAFGGMGDRRRVWRFNGTKWEVRSGTAGANSLLDVEHNALAVDRSAPGNIYVGADIGVWHSPDGGLNWNPLENGLPDAPVFDLQIHPTQRLLRAAIHGRGVYEIPLS